MLIVGITGGIATGKSLVTRLFANQGAVVFSADQAARAVLTPRGLTLRAISQAFGAEFIGPNGSLDRSLLAKRVFADPAARETLNRIMHPPILRLLRAQIDACRDDLPPDIVVAVEVPLLFETKMQAWFERIVVVTASECVQVERLAARDHLAAAQARQRLSAQMPLEAKVRQADIVIHNDGSMSSTERQAAECWPRLLLQAKSASNRADVPSAIFSPAHGAEQQLK